MMQAETMTGDVDTAFDPAGRDDLGAQDSDDPPQRFACDVDIRDARWEADRPDLAPLLRAVANALDEKAEASGTFGLALGDDVLLRDLNAQFREQDKPTNVLSFPAAPLPDGAVSEGGTCLGDVAISFDRTQIEATEQGIAFADHAAHLIVHGLLHLLGFDHETESEAETMERLEAAILAGLGIPDPYRDTIVSHTAGANDEEETARERMS